MCTKKLKAIILEIIFCEINNHAPWFYGFIFLNLDRIFYLNYQLVLRSTIITYYLINVLDVLLVIIIGSLELTLHFSTLTHHKMKYRF